MLLRNPHRRTKRNHGIQDRQLMMFVLTLLFIDLILLCTHILLEGIGKFHVNLIPSKEQSSTTEGVSSITYNFM